MCVAAIGSYKVWAYLVLVQVSQASIPTPVNNGQNTQATQTQNGTGP